MHYCFFLRVRPELLEEYIERHAAVSPDMLRALKQGWERYSLFARPDGLIVGYLEAEDLAAAQRAIDGDRGEHPVAARDAQVLRQRRRPRPRRATWCSLSPSSTSTTSSAPCATHS